MLCCRQLPPMSALRLLPMCNWCRLGCAYLAPKEPDHITCSNLATGLIWKLRKAFPPTSPSPSLCVGSAYVQLMSVGCAYLAPKEPAHITCSNLAKVLILEVTKGFYSHLTFLSSSPEGSSRKGRNDNTGKIGNHTRPRLFDEDETYTASPDASITVVITKTQHLSLSWGDCFKPLKFSSKSTLSRLSQWRMFLYLVSNPPVTPSSLHNKW